MPIHVLEEGFNVTLSTRRAVLLDVGMLPNIHDEDGTERGWVAVFVIRNPEILERPAVGS